MNNYLNKIFKQKGMKTFWTAIGTSLSTSAIWLYVLSGLFGFGEQIPLFYVFLLLISGGGIVYFVHS